MGRTTRGTPTDRRSPPRNGAAAVDVGIGRLLRDARRLSGLTQKTLALTLGVSVWHYRKCESGRSRMTPSQLAQAASALDVPMAYLFQDLPGRRGPPAATGPFSPDEIEVIRSYRAIADMKVREEVRHLLRNVGGRFCPDLLSKPTFRRKR